RPYRPGPGRAPRPLFRVDSEKRFGPAGGAGMETEKLSAALEREHREIDTGIEQYTTGVGAGGVDTAPLKRAMEGLRRHIYLEEEFLFPPLRAGGLMAPLFVMVKEHGELWQTMDRIE